MHIKNFTFTVTSANVNSHSTVNTFHTFSSLFCRNVPVKIVIHIVNSGLLSAVTMICGAAQLIVALDTVLDLAVAYHHQLCLPLYAAFQLPLVIIL